MTSTQSVNISLYFQNIQKKQKTVEQQNDFHVLIWGQKLKDKTDT